MRSEGLKHEGASVEPALDIAFTAREDRGLARRIRPVIAGACIGLVLACNDGLRETALQREDGSELPSSDDGVGNSTPV